MCRYGAALGAGVASAYPESQYSSAYWASSDALGDAIVRFTAAFVILRLRWCFPAGVSQFSCYVHDTARWIALARSRPGQDASPVFVYFFNHTLQVVRDTKPQLGVYHSSELNFVFNYPRLLQTPAEQQLAVAFVKYWASFAWHGVPGVPELPPMPQYTLLTREVCVIDTVSICTPVQHLKDAVCNFWDANQLPVWFAWGS